MVYVFNVKKVSYGSIAVEASNEEEAKAKAWEEYDSGNTYWDNYYIDIDFDYKEERE